MARSRTATKKKTLTVNFKGVEGRVTLPEGDYAVKVSEVTVEEGQSAEYLKWKFEVTEGKFEGKFVYTNTSLSPQALWNLRGLLEAMGVETPDDDMDLDLEDYADRELMITIEHESYEGKKQARVVDYAAIEEDDKPAKKSMKKEEVEEEDEKPTRASRRAARKAAAEEDEDDKPAKKSRRAEPEEEDDKPARGKKSSKKTASVTADDIQDMSQDELEDLVSENDLELDLSKVRTLTKMRNQVIDAMVEAELIEA